MVKAKGGGWHVIDPFYRMVSSPTGWVARNRSVAKNNKTLIYLGTNKRVNAQGGIHTRAGILDRTFPMIRSKAREGSTAIEQLIVIKDDNYIAYYSDMFRSLNESNANAVKPYDFCGRLGWCDGK
jgi:hypothetical protein